jgi:hypothetical protein
METRDLKNAADLLVEASELLARLGTGAARCGGEEARRAHRAVPADAVPNLIDPLGAK